MPRALACVATVVLFQAAVANQVARVVGELKDTHAEGVIGVDEIHIGLNRIAALEAQPNSEDAMPFGGAKIGRGGGEAKGMLIRVGQVASISQHADGKAAILQGGHGGQDGIDAASGQVR
jgi:hypothetical protein